MDITEPNGRTQDLGSDGFTKERDGSSARRRRKRFGRHLSFCWLPRQSSPQAPDATDFKGETLTFTKSTTKGKFSFLVLGSVVYRTSTQLLETLLLACFHERELRPALKWYDKAQSNASSLTTFGIAPVEFTNRLETARLQSNLTAIAPTQFLEEKRAIAYDERVHYRTLTMCFLVHY